MKKEGKRGLLPENPKARSKRVEKIAEREREQGIDSNDAAGRWLRAVDSKKNG